MQRTEEFVHYMRFSSQSPHFFFLKRSKWIPAGLWQSINHKELPTLCQYKDDRVLLVSQTPPHQQPNPGLESLKVAEMEEVDSQGEGPMAVRDGPSGRSKPSDIGGSSNTNTTTNLLASVKEQVGWQTYAPLLWVWLSHRVSVHVCANCLHHCLHLTEGVDWNLQSKSFACF